jgi:hypothetical protein
VRREAGAQPRDEKIERMGECGAIDTPVFSDRRGMTARGVGQVGDFQQGRFSDMGAIQPALEVPVKLDRDYL